MAKSLVLTGFKVTPIVYVYDPDALTMEYVQLRESEVGAKDLGGFAAETWPVMWASLQQQYADEMAAMAAAAAPPPPPRKGATNARKRAVKKATPAKKAAARKKA